MKSKDFFLHAWQTPERILELCKLAEANEQIGENPALAT
jgi:hypothetical protein